MTTHAKLFACIEQLRKQDMPILFQYGRGQMKIVAYVRPSERFQINWFIDVLRTYRSEINYQCTPNDDFYDHGRTRYNVFERFNMPQLFEAIVFL